MNCCHIIISELRNLVALIQFNQNFYILLSEFDKHCIIFRSPVSFQLTVSIMLTLTPFRLTEAAPLSINLLEKLYIFFN